MELISTKEILMPLFGKKGSIKHKLESGFASGKVIIRFIVSLPKEAGMHPTSRLPGLLPSSGS